jgi:hypothetical protein
METDSLNGLAALETAATGVFLVSMLALYQAPEAYFHHLRASRRRSSSI